MRISIDAKELNALAYAVAYSELKYYTIPTSKQDIISVVIKQRDGKDITNLDAWHLCKLMVAKFERDHAFEEYRKLQQPENTVVIVEPVDQLP